MITETVRKLRRAETPAEKLFWRVIRNRGLDGYKFLRQHPIFFEYEHERRFFVADFYCHACRLVVEIDGGIHAQQQEYDSRVPRV
jgi:very-short-patch-repair endonuclease